LSQQLKLSRNCCTWN